MLEPGGTADAFEVIDGSDVTEATDAREDFDARFAPVRDRLLRITGSLVGADEAEDVVQDTYLLGRRRFGQLREHDAFEPWITRIAVNVCYSRHRRTKRLRQLLPALLPMRPTGSDVGLRELIEHLPPRERTVLVLQLDRRTDRAHWAERASISVTDRGWAAGRFVDLPVERPGTQHSTRVFADPGFSDETLFAWIDDPDVRAVDIWVPREGRVLRYTVGSPGFVLQFDARVGPVDEMRYELLDGHGAILAAGSVTAWSDEARRN